MINQPVIIPEQRLCFSQKQAFSMLLFNGSNRCEVAKLAFCSEDVPPSHKATEDRGNRCEVAKLAFCSEDVKTAALPPCEVAPDGGGCV